MKFALGSWLGSRRYLLRLPLVLLVGGLFGLGVPVYQNVLGTYSVVIASSPAAAAIMIDGEAMGTAPLTVELKRGIYTIEARLAGYEAAQQAVFISAQDANIVNIQLPPTPDHGSDAPTPSIVPEMPVENADSVLFAELEKVKAALIANPDEALSLPLLRERLRVQEELYRALRDDLRDVKEQNKWFLGSMIAIIVGLLGIMATLLAAQRAGKTS